MSKRRFIFGFVVVNVLIALALFTVSQTSAQQCIPRNDWPTYTVRRGDSLSTIARRYNSATSVIQQANCLTSTVLRAGQVLRVPPAPGTVASLPEFPLSSYFVGVTYLPFERGFMIWFSNSGSIWVFSNDSGRVTSYPLSSYGGLSDGLRLIETLPAAMSIPRQGFGRVWQNFRVVREQLGYATSTEQGYDTYIQRPSFGLSFYLTLRDSRVIQLNPDGSWAYVQPIPPGPTADTGSAPLTGTTFLPFENGFMTWSAIDGNIRVYIGGKTGELTVFTPGEYGRLSVDTRRVPPAERFRPEGGFGKVWSNFPNIRERIGWATSTEQGYLSVERGISFTLPDGRIVTNVGGNAWTVSEIAAPPTPYIPPTITPGPSPTPFPTFPPPTLTSTLEPLPGTTNFRVGATFQPFANGFMVWRSDNGDILVYSAQRLSVYPIASYGALTINYNIPFPEGRGIPSIRPENGFGKLWSNFPNVRAALGWGAGSEEGYVLDLAVRAPNLPARFTLPHGGVVSTSDGTTWTVTGQYSIPFTYIETMPLEATPTATASFVPTEMVSENLARVQAAYQPFERGFMVWRSDTEHVFAFTGETGGLAWIFFQSGYQDLPNPTDESPNVALLRPINAFGKVWGNHSQVREALGWATQPEQCYFATITDSSSYSRMDVPEHGIVDFSAITGSWSQPSLGNRPDLQPPLGC